MSKINPDKFGGPYENLNTEAKRQEFRAQMRRNKRMILERIIAENDSDDPGLVEIAKIELAEMNAEEGR